MAMASLSERFDDLIELARLGDEAAAQELLRCFEPHVRRIVRRRLPRAMRPKYDSIDFVQSVWKSFFPRLRSGEVAFQSPEHLCQFLTQVASNKVVTEFRRRVAGKDLASAREQTLSAVEQEQRAKGGIAQSTEPTATLVAEAQERWEDILSDLPLPHRKIMELRLKGHRFREIAALLGHSVRTIRRVIDQARAKQGIS